MLTVPQIAELKRLVKAEMARRSGNGSLTSFAGADWEFTIQPESGGRVLAEHGKKVINPLLEVEMCIRDRCMPVACVHHRP